MNLGIVVVYMLREENAPLLDLHLRMIERHTTVPWTIYAGVNRLDERFVDTLRRHPRVEIVPLPETSLVMAAGHSHDLQLLTNHAANNGCSYIATLHPDSFPIRDRWVEELDAQLSIERPLAAILESECGDTMARPCPAGMLMRAEFWREKQPSFLPTDAEVQSPDFRAFLARHGQDPIHSGIGIGWLLDREGMSWLPLRRSNRRNDHHTLAGIYGETFFHLGAAVRGKYFWLDYPRNLRNPLARGLHRVTDFVERRVSARAIELARRSLPLPLLQMADRRGSAMRISARISERLFRDPDAYIASLR